METASSSTEQSSSAQSNREDATKRLFKSIYEQVITHLHLITNLFGNFKNVIVYRKHLIRCFVIGVGSLLKDNSTIR